ncbi:MAG: hypothetical protein MSA15_17600 [Clostridium sp.]|nr:hypothetical protein [Clostridium sp.]
MNKEELIGKLQMVYVGDKNALNEMIDYYDELFDEMSDWREEVKELKKLLEENKDKINWYENFEINKTIDKLRVKHNNQQKEFIKWLEDYLNLFDYRDIGEQAGYDMLEEILQKYKEIIRKGR